MQLHRCCSCMTGWLFGPCTQVHGPGSPTIRVGKGWRGRRELAPRCSATQLGAFRNEPGQTRRFLNYPYHTHHTPHHTTHQTTDRDLESVFVGVGAGRRGRIAFGAVLLGVMLALARLGKSREREVHRHVRLLTLRKVLPLLPECKLAKDGLPNRMVKIPSLSVFRPMLSLSC